MCHSPENDELEGVIRNLGQSLRSNLKVDREESWGWSSPVLIDYAKGCLKSQSLIALLDGTLYERGGDEHQIYSISVTRDRFYKSTYGENYGCSTYFSSIDPELTGKNFHGQSQSDPILYLKRWFFLNLLGDYQTRYEGILLPDREGHLPKICVSQEALRIDNPDLYLIEKAFKQNDYLKVSEDAFIHMPTGILLTDAAPRNVRLKEGEPVPFDAIAQIPTSPILHWIQQTTGYLPTLCDDVLACEAL